VIDDEKLQNNCEVVGTHFIQELSKLKDEIELIGDVRGKGLMIGVELVQDKVKVGFYFHILIIDFTINFIINPLI